MNYIFRNTLIAIHLTLLTILTGCKTYHTENEQLSTKYNFNENWKFIRQDEQQNQTHNKIDFDDTNWQNITLPHTANIEPAVVTNQWQGICWYRKNFDINNISNDKKYIIEFEAIMNKVDIYINGKFAKTYQGGYLPVVINATPFLKEGSNNISLKLDNNDNPITGPKPLKIGGFQTYSGIYRNAWLITKNKLHITNPILANKVASGGIFVSYPKVSNKKSIIKIQTHIANDFNIDKDFKVIQQLYHKGNLVNETQSENISIKANSDIENIIELELYNAKLWSAESPNLYNLKTIIKNDDQILDIENTKIGIRKFTFKDNKLYINDKKTFLRGVNRHQEYPCIGYALSDNAQYRDALKIKNAGFNAVRLSHYPQSTSFMNACDELGLVVLDSILGWQYYNKDPKFSEQTYKTTRDLIRRDRNHPCVLTWEVSLNETYMPTSFMQELNRIAHQESPIDNTYSCGWRNLPYDIYLQARQHRIIHKDEMIFNKPYFVSEYGDWEYFSQKAGLNQENLTGRKRLEKSSRQFRSDGEKGMLQQAYNVQQSHNDNLNIPAFGDAYWAMFDYNIGVHPTLDNPGIMDIYRLPKFAYYFYKSQKNIKNDDDIVLKIASYWDSNSSTAVKIFSNCDKVSLYLNDKLIATQEPDSDKNSTNINHPPFTFNVGKFEKGTLKAIGFIDNKEKKQATVTTPQKPIRLKLSLDISCKQPKINSKDTLFLYISAVDKNSTLCHNFTDKIEIEAEGVKIINKNEISTQAGIATAIIEIQKKDSVKIKAYSGNLKGELSFNLLK